MSTAVCYRNFKDGVKQEDLVLLSPFLRRASGTFSKQTEPATEKTEGLKLLTVSCPVLGTRILKDQSHKAKGLATDVFYLAQSNRF